MESQLIKIALMTIFFILILSIDKCQSILPSYSLDEIANNSVTVCHSVNRITKGTTDLSEVSYVKQNKAEAGVKYALENILSLNINSIPCTCVELKENDEEEHDKRDTYSRPNNKNPVKSCKCPMMTEKKGILNKLKKVVKEKVYTVYKLNKKIRKEEESQRKTNEVCEMEADEVEAQDIPLPYEILRQELEEIHSKNLKLKKRAAEKVFLGNIPKDLLFHGENTFREKMGPHRVLPKEIKKNFILERAFKNRKTMEEQLYEGYVCATKKVMPCANILNFKPSKLAKQSETEIDRKSSKENVKDEVPHYTFPGYISDPTTALCECKRVAAKIARLEHIKDLLYLVLDTSNSMEQMNLINQANGLLKLMTEEQIEENIRKSSLKLETSYSESESEPHLNSVETKRKYGSPSFECFRRRILHEMHVERRTISKPEQSLIIQEKFKDVKKLQAKKALNEAIRELLELHYSKPYSRLLNPDEYVLKKLTMIVKKYLKSESNNEEINPKITTETSLWPKGKISDRNHPIYNLLHEVRLCGSLIKRAFNQNKDEDKDETDKETCSCPSLQMKFQEHAKLVKEVQDLFIDAVYSWGSTDETYQGKIKQETNESIEDSKVHYFKSIDLSKLKINFWEHNANGQILESYNRGFDDSWKNSVLNGLFIFNPEIQVMEKERIIIRTQKEKGVKIMSGGRVGQEPLYSEYVAKGMLDCVVLGDKYSGPSVRNILQGMLELATEEGILIIIMNEHEYRLNFMIAMQQAEELGITTELVLAKDDASYEKHEHRGNGRRGSAGIVLQFKVAGAMAEEGYSLAAISRVCQFMFIASISCYMDESNIYTGATLKPGTGQLLMKIVFDSSEKVEGKPFSEKIEKSIENSEPYPQDDNSNSGVLTLTKDNSLFMIGSDENSALNNFTAPITNYILQEDDYMISETDKFLDKLRSNPVKDYPHKKSNKIITPSIRTLELCDIPPGEKIKIEGNIELTEMKKILFEQLSQAMLNILLDRDSPHYIAPEPETEVILLLNNQNHSYDHMYTIANEIRTILNEISITLARVYIGNFMALPTDGFTITLAKDLEKKLIPFLDKTTTCNIWPPHTSGGVLATQVPTKKITVTPLGACVHKNYIKVIENVYVRLIQEMKMYKNYYEMKEPKLAIQVSEIIKTFPQRIVFKELPLNRPYQMLLNLADDFKNIDSFGLYLSIFLTSAAQEFNINPKIYITSRMCCNAFYRGACSLAGYMKYEKGDGSILDVLLPLSKACFDTKQGWNPLMYFKFELDQLEEANWLNREDPGIMFCMRMMKCIYKTFHDAFGQLEWSAWEEKEDNIFVVISDSKKNKRYGFCTEKIQPDIKDDLKDLSFMNFEMKLAGLQLCHMKPCKFHLEIRKTLEKKGVSMNSESTCIQCECGMCHTHLSPVLKEYSHKLTSEKEVIII